MLFEVYSASCLYLISCWGGKCTHPHNPFVLNVLQPLTLRTPAGHTSPMANLCQLLLWGHHWVQEGPGIIYMNEAISKTPGGGLFYYCWGNLGDLYTFVYINQTLGTRSVCCSDIRNSDQNNFKLCSQLIARTSGDCWGLESDTLQSGGNLGKLEGVCRLKWRIVITQTLGEA